ncbi:MAG: hypothetical protein SFV51_10010 [Bryobacteraceae bacterium]|nr:hypothetical protein [Bryobacteraceae bacterium]
MKENFHQFQFNFYKEREMSDFRKSFLTFAAVTLFAGLANAQPIVCNTTAQPLTVRTEGLAEQTGDIIIQCTGGVPQAIGTSLAQINISVTLSTNITSRFVADPLTEALLFIDDPQPGNQFPCAGSGGVCSPLTAGVGGTALLGTSTVNIFQGVRQNASTVVFLGVPINPPGSSTRTIRIKNIRAAIAGTSAQNGQIFAFVSIQNPPANLQLNNSTQNVAFVQQGLEFVLRNVGGTDSFSSTAAGVALAQCEDWNDDMAANNAEDYEQNRSHTVRFREAYAASWKVRDINPPLFDPPLLQQNFPQFNNGFDPSLSTVVESGFFNTAFTTANGLNRAGRADHGTRLRIVFNNVPTNIRVYVSAHSLNNIAYACASGSCAGSGDATAYTRAYGVSTANDGSNIAAGTVLVNPLSDAEAWTGTSQDLSGVAGFPTGARAGAVEVPIVNGSGVFTWEVFGQDPLRIDTASFAIATAVERNNNPGTGIATINGSFAPVSTINTMSATAPIPRFADQSTAINAFRVDLCRTVLLFPFVSNQAGFDTGVAISNTSSDPFGTAQQSGNCELNYYGGTTGGGAAPSKQTTSSPVQSGQVAAFTLSSGGTNGIAATPGFQGYMIATCQFRYAHGFAFISDVGAQRLSHGYLALIIQESGGLFRDVNTPGETLGQ